MAAEAPLNVDESGLAVQGYDPVSYFDGAPVAGDAAVTAEHGGATYRFASEENKAKFEASPEAFAPAFGGYCATGVHHGRLVPVDPEDYLVDKAGRLLLFFKNEEVDTREAWLGDESIHASAAEQWAAGGLEPFVPGADAAETDAAEAEAAEAEAAPAAAEAPLNVDESGLAVQGYDPVSYFDGAPVAGDAAVTAEHGGATYRFASEENKAKFEASPEAFAPAFGGYCATGVHHGRLVPVDPEDYLVDKAGRLLLFFKNEEVDTREAWLGDESIHASAAEKWAAGGLEPFVP